MSVVQMFVWSALTGHQAMSLPARKYPLSVFLLTLQDDWKTHTHMKQFGQNIKELYISSIVLIPPNTLIYATNYNIC